MGKDISINIYTKKGLDKDSTQLEELQEYITEILK